MNKQDQKPRAEDLGTKTRRYHSFSISLLFLQAEFSILVSCGKES
jgi:hypothetical protein